MKKLLTLSTLLFSLLLTSCVYISLPETSDPEAKLQNAQNYIAEGQPLPAERLILESIRIYEAENNSEGLGNAYRDFGILLQSNAITQREQTYRQAGFLDSSITYENRFEKANEYLSKAISAYDNAANNYKNQGRFDLLSSLYYQQANIYLLQNNQSMACSLYDQSRNAYAESAVRNTSIKPNIPDGFSSFHDAISAAKVKAGCL